MQSVSVENAKKNARDDRTHGIFTQGGNKQVITKQYRRDANNDVRNDRHNGWKCKGIDIKSGHLLKRPSYA